VPFGAIALTFSTTYQFLRQFVGMLAHTSTQN
jgi:hypothetical protein